MTNQAGQGTPDPLQPLRDLDSELHDLERDARIADRLIGQAMEDNYRNVELNEEACHSVFRLRKAVADFKALYSRVWDETVSQVKKHKAGVAS
jgi:hypothetical protein